MSRSTSPQHLGLPRARYGVACAAAYAVKSSRSAPDGTTTIHKARLTHVSLTASPAKPAPRTSRGHHSSRA